MRNLISITTLISILLFSCYNPKNDCSQIEKQYAAQIDSIKLKNVSLLQIISIVENKNKELEKNIYVLNDSITYKNIQINDVKKYLKICIKDPSQNKFLLGWCRRAVNYEN